MILVEPTTNVAWKILSPNSGADFKIAQSTTKLRQVDAFDFNRLYVKVDSFFGAAVEAECNVYAYRRSHKLLEIVRVLKKASCYYYCMSTWFSGREL